MPSISLILPRRASVGVQRAPRSPPRPVRLMRTYACPGGARARLEGAGVVSFDMRKSAFLQAERARKLRFERLVVRALRSLPPGVHAALDNVAIVVEDEPTGDQLDAESAEDDTLFGLYQGVPLTERGSGYSIVLPDKITIFRRPLERACATPVEMEREVRTTVIHELAHHFGFEEDRITELGYQ